MLRKQQEADGTIAETKITKVGGSIGVILDRKILTEVFRWGEGTPVEVKYDGVKQSITIRKNGGNSE